MSGHLAVTECRALGDLCARSPMDIFLSYCMPLLTIPPSSGLAIGDGVQCLLRPLIVQVCPETAWPCGLSFADSLNCYNLAHDATQVLLPPHRSFIAPGAAIGCQRGSASRRAHEPERSMVPPLRRGAAIRTCHWPIRRDPGVHDRLRHVAQGVGFHRGGGWFSSYVNYGECSTGRLG